MRASASLHFFSPWARTSTDSARSSAQPASIRRGMVSVTSWQPRAVPRTGARGARGAAVSLVVVIAVGDPHAPQPEAVRAAAHTRYCVPGRSSATEKSPSTRARVVPAAGGARSPQPRERRPHHSPTRPATSRQDGAFERLSIWRERRTRYPPLWGHEQGGLPTVADPAADAVARCNQLADHFHLQRRRLRFRPRGLIQLAASANKSRGCGRSRGQALSLRLVGRSVAHRREAAGCPLGDAGRGGPKAVRPAGADGTERQQVDELADALALPAAVAIHARVVGFGRARAVGGDRRAVGRWRDG